MTTATAPITGNCRTTDYAYVQRLLFKIVHKFQRFHGGDFDELMCEANYHYVRALQNYDPEKARFSTWCTIKVLNGLKDYHSRQARYLSLYKQEGEEMPLELAPERRHGNLGALLSELSEDACYVAKLAMMSARSEHCNRPHVFRRRSWITRFLLDMGWSGERIMEAFGEIKQALRERS
jgi:hypothetical protein